MIYLATKTGLNKSQSEDRILVGNQVFCNQSATLPLCEGLICVADGVGGHAGGAIASDYVAHSLAAIAPIQLANDGLLSQVRAVNQGLLAQGDQNPALARMATTLSGVMLRPGRQQSVHVGNTRISLWDGKRLWQLTTDHTRYQRLRQLGLEKEANECNKNAITSCLGGGKESLADELTTAPLPQFRTLLLTSDGVHDHVAGEQIASILSTGLNGLDKCQSLLAAALANNSRDDLSALLICIE